MENDFKKKLKNFFEKLKWLDPFTYVDLFVMPRVKKITENKLVENLVNVFFAMLFAIIIFFLLGIVLGTGSPLVIVYSESMEPYFYRGDIIVLTGLREDFFLGEKIYLERNLRKTPLTLFAETHYSNDSLERIVFENEKEVYPKKEGSVVVYNSFPYNIPIIHRSVVEIVTPEGSFLLTKGDNQKTNNTIDQDCGFVDELRMRTEKDCITFYPVPVDEVEGVMLFRIPVLGCIKLWLFDNMGSLITTGQLPPNFKGIC